MGAWRGWWRGGTDGPGHAAAWLVAHRRAAAALDARPPSRVVHPCPHPTPPLAPAGLLPVLPPQPGAAGGVGRPRPARPLGAAGRCGCWVLDAKGCCCRCLHTGAVHSSRGVRSARPPLSHPGCTSLRPTKSPLHCTPPAGVWLCEAADAAGGGRRPGGEPRRLRRLLRHLRRPRRLLYLRHQHVQHQRQRQRAQQRARLLRRRQCRPCGGAARCLCGGGRGVAQGGPRASRSNSRQRIAVAG